MSTNPCLSTRNGTVRLDTLHDIEVAGYRYVILTICVFGIVCNILNLCVLLQRRLKESPYTYLTGLALADMLTLISISPFSIVRGDYIRHENIFFDLTRFESRIYMPLANYFGQVSIMITLALTIERYLFTKYPLRTQSFCKSSYARIVIALILIVCGIISIPRFLSETVEKIMGPQATFNSSLCSTHPFVIRQSWTNRSHIGQCFCVASHTRKNFLRFKDAYYYILFILNQILPFAILLYLNLKLIKRVQHSNRFTLIELVARQKSSLLIHSTPHIQTIKQKRIRDEQRLTKTLVSIVLVFLVCNTFTIVSYPEFVHRVTRHKYPDYIRVGFRLQKLITNIMLLLNYSVNFFFYCAFNQKFLDTLRMTFQHGCCCRRRSRRENRSFQNGHCLTLHRSYLTGTSTTSNSSILVHPKYYQPTRRTITMSDEHETFDE